MLEVSSEITENYSHASNNPTNPTNGRPHGQSDAVAALLDQVDDVPVVERVDLNVVHGKNSVSNLEATTSLSWRACKHEIFLAGELKISSI